MQRLARLSLANRALIVLVCLFVTVFGLISVTQLKQELIPSVEFPRLTVSAVNPGASPEVMDKQVSQPLERAMQGVEGLESSSSTSRASSSVVSLTFTYGTDLDRARSQVDRAISNVQSQLPKDVQPTAFAGSVDDFPIVYYAVSGEGSLASVADRVEAEVSPAVLKLDGVRNVEVSGAATQYVSVLPDEKKLVAQGLSVGSLKDAIEKAGGTLPLGQVTQGKLALPIQTSGALDSLKAIEALPLKGKDGVLTLGSVATVAMADEATTSITRTNGERTLAVSITKKPDADTVRVSEAVRAALPALSKQADANFTLVFDQAPSISNAIHDLTVEGLLGLAFAVLIILVFLLSLRSTLVTAISIPLSLLVTFIGVWAFGFSLNMLTLGALTISIGRVVDDSIVVIENIKRHLSYAEPRGRAILTAVGEVSGAITASTLTTVAVFLPVAFVGDLAGELFRPFALTVTLALLASLVVSLTIVPVLAYWFLAKHRGNADNETSPRDVRAEADRAEQRSWLQKGYIPLLRGTQHHPVLTLLASLLILGGTVAMVPHLKYNLLGGTGQQAFSATLTMPAGSSLETTDRASAPLEKALHEVDGVKDVQVSIGSGGTGIAALFGSGGGDVASFTVTADDGREVEPIVDAARIKLQGLDSPGKVEVSATESGGFSSKVTVRVKAPTPQALAAANAAVVKAMEGIPESTAVESDLTSSSPLVRVDVDRKKAAEAGLSQEQIAGLVAGTVNPVPASEVTFGFTTYDVKIGEGRRLDSLDALKKLQIPTSKGPATLSDFASIAQVEQESTIHSADTDRISTVSITPTEAGLGQVSAEVSKRLGALTLDGGASASLGGAATQQAESFKQLGLALLAAIAIVYVIMVATFKSLVQPLILLVSVPFAATGSIALLLISGVPLGIASLIGMLMLVGIVVTNAIVLIDLINQYRRPAPGRAAMDLDEAIVHGARRRLRPILMTALATICAMIPMALGLTGSGGFISQPLAVVVVGGLVSSTLLTLILVPVLYRLVEGRRERRRLAGLGPVDDGLED